MRQISREKFHLRRCYNETQGQGGPWYMKAWTRLISGLSFGLIAASANASMVSIVGSLLYSKPTYQDLSVSQSISAKLGYGAGLLADFRVARRVSVQLGALYQMRSFGVTTAGITATNTSTFVDVPLLIRVGLGPFFSIGVGGYYDSALGKIKNSIGALSAWETYKAEGITTDDYGVLANAAVALPLGKMTRLLIDGRYRYGLANRFQGSSTGKMLFRDMQVLMGFQFGFGGKKK
jgi:hypothetical protein